MDCMSTDWPFGGLQRHGYGVIAADPPWRFKAGNKSSRSAERHYPTMPLPDIKALPVHLLAADDCALLLWTTPPFLKQSMEVMAAWRFRYVSIAYTWLKLKKGHSDEFFMDGDMFVSLGHTTRKSSEVCLLGKRGRPARLNRDVEEVILAARREHSRKPEEFYRRTQRLYAGPYLELFSRTDREGWSVYGNETGKFNSTASSIVSTSHGDNVDSGARPDGET